MNSAYNAAVKQLVKNTPSSLTEEWLIALFLSLLSTKTTEGVSSVSELNGLKITT